MKYVVFDSETTIRNAGEGSVGSNKASPFHPSNFIVAHGEYALKRDGGDKRLSYRTEGEPLDPPWILTTEHEVTVVGVNLPFDLKWLWREWPELFWKKLPTLHIWDVQQGEYLLTGQDHKFASLNEMSEALGLPLKDNRLHDDYWSKGIDTTMIPKDMLMDYLGSTDLENPMKIFAHQWKRFQENPKLFALAKIKMDDILATTVMEIHGMAFDLVKANEKIEELDAQLQEVLVRIKEAVEKKKIFVENFDFNPESDDQIAVAVFGGTYKVEENVPSLDKNGCKQYFKGGARKGELKTHREKVSYTTKGFKLPKGQSPKMASGNYSSAAEYLEPLAERSEFVRDVLKMRELVKDVDTYFRGYSKMVFPDGMIHPNYNHPGTETGRLSASQPNLQNVTKEDE